MIIKGEKMEKFVRPRPEFPKRAVITSGMPYGNKELHFAHFGGYMVHADTFARFLRDRIGEENVVFVSGTDCYGSPAVEAFRKLKAEGKINFDTIEEFVKHNHEIQKQTYLNYEIEHMANRLWKEAFSYNHILLLVLLVILHYFYGEIPI